MVADAQVVRASSSAPPVGGTRTANHPTGVPGEGTRRRKPRKPPALTLRQSERLSNKLRRVVCSDPWHDHCKSLILAGEIPHKENQARELHRTRAYPPGGAASGMLRCCCCGCWAPRARYTRQRTAEPRPDGSVLVTYTPWQPVCIDCFHGEMPLTVMVHVPSSPGFDRRMKDAELPAHVEGSSLHVRRRRRRNAPNIRGHGPVPETSPDGHTPKDSCNGGTSNDLHAA